MFSALAVSRGGLSQQSRAANSVGNSSDGLASSRPDVVANERGAAANSEAIGAEVAVPRNCHKSQTRLTQGFAMAKMMGV
jgi:hypothetical protein